jgi:hypothetical protein
MAAVTWQLGRAALIDPLTVVIALVSLILLIRFRWNSMGYAAKGVAIILALMSAYSISVMIERWLTYRQARKQSRVFTPAVAECLKEVYNESNL